ncbi:MAG TPA: Gfo/Idh/MocA family oxidoreductase [Bacillota bacterium]|nr:Gfo/Idh/MocA family oxidoreductase [Bacillota bacterium]
MKKIRWGILSTAKIAQKELISAFQRSKNAKVIAIASGSSLNKAREIAEEFQIDKAYDSYEKLLGDSEIDAVYIPLPNHLHKKWVIKAAEAKKHILCEKPAALNTAEVIEMKTACEKNNVLFMEAFMHFFHPQHNRVKEIINSGEIGEVRYMRASFSFYLNEKEWEHNFRMNEQNGGGSLYDIGCYTIHSLRNILCVEPETVHSYATLNNAYNVDTDVISYLTFPNNVKATFDISFNATNRCEYEVVGTDGRIIVPRAYRPDLNGGDGLVRVEKQGVIRTETINADQYCNQVSHISAAIQEGKCNVNHDFSNTIHNMKVIDACHASIASKKQVNIS